MKDSIKLFSYLAVASLALSSNTSHAWSLKKWSWSWANNLIHGHQLDIIGGSEVDQADPIASTTVAFLTGDALCTASIVDTDLAITAAHCVYGTPTSKMALVFGTQAQTNVGQHVGRVVAAAYHPDYDAEGLSDIDHHDIALIRFSGGIPAGYAKADLLLDDSALQAGDTVTLAGYGITDGATQEGAGVLRKVDVQIQEPNLGDTEIVFDQTQGRGACHGDSGGPAFVNQDGKYYVMGVTSRGYNDDANLCNQEAVYTKVAPFASWLKSEAKILRAKKTTTPSRRKG